MEAGSGESQQVDIVDKVTAAWSSQIQSEAQKDTANFLANSKKKVISNGKFVAFFNQKLVSYTAVYDIILCRM